MKKTFALTHPKIHRDRLVEGVKGDIRKYLKRERKKRLPEGFDFWDFDCKCGASADEAAVVHVAELGTALDAVAVTPAETCYIEMLAKPTKRMSRAVKGTEDAR